MSQFRLLREQRFRPFFLTQFLGAFNDNLFKNALVVLLTFQAASWTTIAPALLANLAAGIFILPFFLSSATAGQLEIQADATKHSGDYRKIIEGFNNTLNSLLASMITVSDNECYNELVRTLGNGSFSSGCNYINKYLKKQGYTGINGIKEIFQYSV